MRVYFVTLIFPYFGFAEPLFLLSFPFFFFFVCREVSGKQRRFPILLHSQACDDAHINLAKAIRQRQRCSCIFPLPIFYPYLFAEIIPASKE